MIAHNPGADAAYPVKLRPRPIEKVWGGRRIETMLQRKLPGTAPIGELWVAWEGLSVTNGPWRGQVLRDIVARERSATLGHAFDNTPVTAFPLLVKILDARENLSIQVHPDDSYAQTIEGQPFGKSELWYVLAADPGATVVHGVRHPLTAAELRSVLATGNINEHVTTVEVKPGDVLLNVPGTIHALGRGVLIYELQQSSDLTYRLYDWDRVGSTVKRPLHIDKSADVSDLRPLDRHRITPLALPSPGADRLILGATRHYAAELWTITKSGRIPAHADRFEIVTALDATMRVRIRGATPDSATLRAGESSLIPPGPVTYEVAAIDRPGRVIRAYVPDLVADLIDPLRRLGVSDDDISQLGGDPRWSDLGPLVRNRIRPGRLPND